MSERLIQLLISSFGQLLTKGLEITIPLTILSFALGLVLAMITSLVQVARLPLLRQLARLYVWIFRGTPLIVQLYIVFYGLPYVGLVLPAFPAAVIVFGLNTGAYASQTIRAAIESIPAGQLQAGYMVGMTWLQTMRRIIIPQAMKTAFPPLFNGLIGLVKDTSLAANITVVEMFRSAQLIAARTYEVFALYCLVALVYLLFCTVLTWIQTWCQKKLSLK